MKTFAFVEGFHEDNKTFRREKYIKGEALLSLHAGNPLETYI